MWTKTRYQETIVQTEVSNKVTVVKRHGIVDRDVSGAGDDTLGTVSDTIKLIEVK